jgi:membrane protease YdiL (CAAX protease family)
MTNFLKISFKLSIISAIFVILSIVAVVIISFMTQGNIHPDYWKLGAPEKVTLYLLLAAYGLVILISLKGFNRTKKKQIKSASPNQ